MHVIDIPWTGKVPLFNLELGRQCYFLPITGRLFRQPRAYLFPQEFIVAGNQLFCSWASRDKVENMLRRRGHYFVPPRAFTLHLGLGFAQPKDGSKGTPWLEPALVYFEQNPVSGDKQDGDWVLLESTERGFHLLTVLHGGLTDFLPDAERDSLVQRLGILARHYPDFSRVLPFPTRAQIHELYRVDEDRDIIPVELLPAAV